MGHLLTDEEVKALRKEANVRLCCDEAHAHSALQDCLIGEPKDIALCKLAETLLRERAAYRRVLESIGTETLDGKPHR